MKTERVTNMHMKVRVISRTRRSANVEEVHHGFSGGQHHVATCTHQHAKCSGLGGLPGKLRHAGTVELHHAATLVDHHHDYR